MGMNVLITGASRGIGKAIALEFGKYGFNTLYLTYNETGRDEMLKLKEELEVLCNTVHLIKMNVADRDEVKRIAYSLKEFNSDFYLDAIINNAGIMRDRTFEKMTDEEWDSVISTNLTGVYNVTKSFLPYMTSVHGGCIINMGSLIGLIGNFGQTNYSASKAGLIAFTKSLSKELAKKNIRVNMVSPSIVDTGIFKNLTKEQYDKLTDRTSLKRMATVEEIAKFVVFLVIEGTYCTGQNYIVDGGFT